MQSTLSFGCSSSHVVVVSIGSDDTVLSNYGQLLCCPLAIRPPGLVPQARPQTEGGQRDLEVLGGRVARVKDAWRPSTCQKLKSKHCNLVIQIWIRIISISFQSFIIWKLCTNSWVKQTSSFKRSDIFLNTGPYLLLSFEYPPERCWNISTPANWRCQLMWQDRMPSFYLHCFGWFRNFVKFVLK